MTMILPLNRFERRAFVIKLLKFRLSYPSVIYEHISCFEVTDFSSFNYTDEFVVFFLLQLTTKSFFHCLHDVYKDRIPFAIS